MHLIADNYATHKHAKVQAWLRRHKRFHMHFTPTSASWINQVERFFGLITEDRIRCGVFKSVAELVAAIQQYLENHNADPKPFVWTASATEILKKVARGRQALQFGTLSCSPFQAAGARIPRSFFKPFSTAATGQGRRHDHETTVDHALMRGLVTAGPVMRRGASSV